jgi:hypothetical protein
MRPTDILKRGIYRNDDEKIHTEVPETQAQIHIGDWYLELSATNFKDPYIPIDKKISG